MVSVLVCFTKELEGRVIDRQYHVFNNCPDSKSVPGYSIEFIFDPIYKAFSAKGYTWSACPFPLELVDKCGFTVSSLEKGV